MKSRQNLISSRLSYFATYVIIYVNIHLIVLMLRDCKCRKAIVAKMAYKMTADESRLCVEQLQSIEQQIRHGSYRPPHSSL